MSDRHFPDFTDTLEWNLVARTTYDAATRVEEGITTFLPLPPRGWVIENSHVLLIGVKAKNPRSTWYTGGWASQRLLFVPSSTTEFTATVKAASKRLTLGSLTLFVAQTLMPTWLLYVEFPRWFIGVTIEIWRYDGRDVDVFQRLDELEAKIDGLPP